MNYKYTGPDGIVYEVVETDQVIDWSGTVLWGRKRAARQAGVYNAGRIMPTCRFGIKHLGLWRWRVISLQNKLVPIGNRGSHE